MGLKIRVKHPLGEKALVLPVRAVERPVTVGRSSSADVQVPSIHIAPVQCVMFVHGGKWAVQDAGGESSGTLVNGRAITQPTVLKIGDVITLGTEVNPPSVKIEGVGGGATAASVPRKPRANASAAPVPAESASPVSDDLVTDSDLGAAAARYQTKKFYVPKGPRMSPGALTAGIVVGVVLVAIIGFMLYRLNERSSQAAALTSPGPAPTAAAAPQSRVVVAQPSAAAKAQRPAPAPVQSSDKAPVEAAVEPNGASIPVRKPFADANAESEPSTNAEKASGDAPAKGDPKAKRDVEWERVEEAYKFVAPQAALLVFEDYKNAFPDSSHAKDIARYTEETLDLLWWHRIKALCDARDIAQEEIRKFDRDIAVESNKEHRAKLIKQRTEVQDRKKQTEEAITKEFGFKEKDPPDLYNSSRLQALRAKRDKALWETFKKNVMDSIRKQRKVPWDE